jgi:hypothetical protein
MKNLMRNLTLSAAALAALVSIAPKADAQNWNRAQGREARPSRGAERGSRGDAFRGQAGRQEGYRGEAFRGNSGRREGFRVDGYRGRESGAREWRGQSFSRPSAAFYGRGYVSPFRVYAGSRFYSTRPGVGYFFVNGLGWVFPPFPGAVWVPAHYDFDGFFIEGGWQ